MRRFLEYSRHHQRRIGAVFLEDGKISRQNITILEYDEDTFIYVSAKQRKPRRMPLEVLLTAGYARGDRGETE